MSEFTTRDHDLTDGSIQLGELLQLAHGWGDEWRRMLASELILVNGERDVPPEHELHDGDIVGIGPLEIALHG